MNNQEIKLFAYQPYGSGQYSFFVMEANEAEAYEYVAQYIKKLSARPVVIHTRVLELTIIN